MFQDININTATSMIPFRGLLRDVKECNNDASCIIERSNLDWKGVKLPLMIQGRKEARPYNRQFGIVNSKTGAIIDGGRPVSANFKTPDNREIINDMCDFASSNGLTIHHAGMLNGGRLVVGHAVHPDTINITGKDKGYATHYGDLSKGINQDLVEAGVIMVASYESGKVSTWRPYANRFVCTNGLVIEAKEVKELSRYRLPHRGEKYDRTQVKGVFESFSKQFIYWAGIVKDLANTPATPVIQTAMLVETLNGDLFDTLINATIERYGVTGGITNRRSYYLDALASTDLVERELLTAVKEKGNRALQAVLDMNETQPGVDFVKGSMAQPYHAVTHWVDHYRGKVNNQDAAVEAGLFGQGAKLKQEALEVAVGYQSWLVQ